MWLHCLLLSIRSSMPKQGTSSSSVEGATMYSEQQSNFLLFETPPRLLRRSAYTSVRIRVATVSLRIVSLVHLAVVTKFF